MVTPFLMDSFEVRDFLAEAISGTFTIQMISAGSMHGAEQLAVAGWTTQVGPTETH
ncbi:hypothetical protein GCM10019059_44680 [Camelimonas fluminis]|uniref:Uncharacterized protein n=1 Tax=Camelimonas fluminis TaxID=1576911 RepID=A0ABV7UIM8_9HYPH|nr:hypothetical protein [Camelimonas fluminis]GHE81994.1 hypothetical protein GCM10019059_44680 [Camelimonas fluminis]